MALARLLSRYLNHDQLYLDMNRFYYLSLFLEEHERQKGSSAVRDLADDAMALFTTHQKADAEELSKTHLKLGYKCFFVLQRLKDLIGLDIRRGQELNDQIDEDLRLVTPDDDAWQKILRTSQNESAKDHAIDVLRKAIGEDDYTFAKFLEDKLVEKVRNGIPCLGDLPDRFQYYAKHTRSIEFLRDGTLQKVYFQQPRMVLDSSKREKVLVAVKRTTTEDKQRSFLDKFKNMHEQLRYQKGFENNRAGKIIAANSRTWTTILLALTVALNLLLLSTWAANPSFSKTVLRGSEETGKIALR